MKKQLITLIAMLLPMLASARDAVEINGIYYYFYNLDNGAKIAQVTKNPNNYQDDVTIPESFEYSGTTYDVTSIGSDAFYQCSSLTSVTIPNSVTTIGGSAFYGCTGLTSVTIGNGVTSIGQHAFAGCSGLISVTIPNSVTYIWEYAFYGCSNLTSVTIPNGVTSIGNFAFAGCSGLTSVTIPNSVTSIGGAAFMGCSSLTSVTIPNSVTSIIFRAFANCSGLTSIKVESGNTKYDSRDNCNAIIETESNTMIAGCKNTTIPNSVTSIGWCTFYGCSDLTSVTIPNSVTSIDSEAFSGTGWYDGQTDGILYLDNWLLGYKGKAPTGAITIADDTKGIAGSAFYSCSDLTSITIPNSVTTIGGSAFHGCSGLASITIPNSVTSIERWAFERCRGLLNVYCYAEKVPTTKSNVFKDSNVANATLHVPAVSVSAYQAASPWNGFKEIVAIEGVTTDNGNIINGIYYNFDSESKTAEVTSNPNKYSGSVVIPEKVKHEGTEYSVTSIGDEAFGECSGLTSITIPNSVTTIGVYAFVGCIGLTSVIIPNSVISIGDEAFYYCSGLTSVIIPSSVTSIGEEAFSSCSGLTSIKVESGNTKYDSRDNCNAIIETASNTLIVGCQNTTIPNGVTSIGLGAFEECSGLTSITIPSSVTSIGKWGSPA